MLELMRAAKDFKAGDSIQIHTCQIKVDKDSITDMGIGVCGYTTIRLCINTTPDASFFVPDLHKFHHYMEFPSSCPECAEEERVEAVPLITGAKLGGAGNAFPRLMPKRDSHELDLCEEKDE